MRGGIMDWRQQYWGLWVGAGIFMITMVVFAIMATAGWPGGADDCLVVAGGIERDNCYCERLRPGWVKQPASTWSDLAFVIAGLSMLAIAGTENRGTAGRNPMVNGSWMANLFGWIIIFMGPGSMYFHASFTDWGGFLDSTSMFLLLTFVVGYDLHQATRGSVWKWLSWIVAVGVLTLALILVVALPAAATPVFITFAVSTGVFDLIIRLAAGLQRSWWWYAGFFSVFGGAMTIWILSGTGGPLCKPDAVLWQGHAWWHALSAAAMVFLFMYFRSESGGRPVA